MTNKGDGELAGPRPEQRPDLNVNLAMAVRLVPGSGAEQPCDERCARWGALPHPHMVMDGLYNDAHPYLTLGGWCSCGFCFDELVTFDMREEHSPELLDHGNKQVAAFTAHMREAHGIDPEADEAWQMAASVDPDTLAG